MRMGTVGRIHPENGLIHRLLFIDRPVLISVFIVGGFTFMPEFPFNVLRIIYAVID